MFPRNFMDMKYISKWCIATLAMAICFLVPACTDDDGQEQAEVSFTAPEDLDMARLDSCESIVTSFELTSNAAWHLYSDKMWVKFSLQPDGEFYCDIQGDAGEFTVYMKVTDEARGFNGSQAVVRLVAGGGSQNVTTIERDGKERTFSLLSAEGEPIERIEIGKEASATVLPVANFECSILSYPSWMDEPEAVSDGMLLNVSDAFVPYEKEGTIAFGNIDGSAVYEVPVTYTGMDSAIITIAGDYTPWGWLVSLDGKKFVQESTASTGESVQTIIENCLVYSVTCLNYDCRFVAVQEKDGKLTLMDESESWIVASQNADNPSQVGISVTPFEATSSARSRSGYLFALPVAIYDDFVSLLASSSDIDTFIDENIRYVMLVLQQKDLEGSNGFVITDNNDTAVPCIAEEEHYEWLCSEFTITDVTTCNLVPGQVYTLDTRLGTDEWKGNYTITDLEGNQQRLRLWRPDTTLQGPDVTVSEDGLYKITFKVPETLNKTVVLRLYTPQIVNIKALVIRPLANDK